MKNLLSDFNTTSEPAKYEAKIHWISYVVPVLYIIFGAVGVLYILLLGYKFILGFIGMIALFLSFLFVKGIIKLLRTRSTKIYVTDRHLSFSTGILGKTISDLSLTKLEGMQLHQSFLGKTLNYGTLVVTTGDVTSAYLIENPMELRNVLIYSKE